MSFSIERSPFLDIPILEVRGPSGPHFLVGGPSSRLDFVLCALQALLSPNTPDASNTPDAVLLGERTDGQGDSRSRIHHSISQGPCLSQLATGPFVSVSVATKTMQKI